MVHSVCLNEDKHAVTILRGLKEMKQEDDFCDFTIKVQHTEYRVHRNVIAVSSPYFKVMLKHDTLESREGKVEMKEVDAECVKSCIDFMYSAKFDIPDGKTDKLLHVAIMMQLEDVKEAICEILKDELIAANFYETKSIVTSYNLKTVSPKCKTFYHENFIAISAQPEFQNEKKSHLSDILQGKNFDLSVEEKLLVLLRWVGEDHEKMNELFDLMGLINLNEASMDCLKDLLQNHPLVSNNLRLYKLINAPLVEFAEKNSKINKDKRKYENELLILFDESSDCIQSHDPSTNEVIKFHNEKFKHFKTFTAITIGSYIYVLCQKKAVHRVNFRDKNSKWEKLADTIADHGLRPLSIAHAGSIYVVGSSSWVFVNGDVEKYDPLTNHWDKLDNKPTAVGMATLVSLLDSIYCIGGWIGFKCQATFCKLTPSTSEWLDLEPMKCGRACCGATATEQKIFVTGGSTVWNEVKQVECYDVIVKQWTSLASMIWRHGWSVAHNVDGWIFSLSDKSNEAEKYNIANDGWCKIDFAGVGDFRIQESLLLQF